MSSSGEREYDIESYLPPKVANELATFFVGGGRSAVFIEYVGNIWCDDAGGTRCDLWSYKRSPLYVMKGSSEGILTKLALTSYKPQRETDNTIYSYLLSEYDEEDSRLIADFVQKGFRVIKR